MHKSDIENDTPQVWEVHTRRPYNISEGWGYDPLY